MPNDEPTIQEVLEAINDYSIHNDKQLAEIRAQMVTKSYLDDKLADLRGDLVVLTRKEDTKLKALVDILAEKKVLSVEETKRIFSMEPFPQLAL